MKLNNTIWNDIKTGSKTSCHLLYDLFIKRAVIVERSPPRCIMRRLSYLAASGGRLHGLVCLLNRLVCRLGYRYLAQVHLVEDVVNIGRRFVVAKGDREENCCALRLLKIGANIYPFPLPELHKRLILVLDRRPDITAAAHNMLRLRGSKPLFQFPCLLWVRGLRIDSIGQTVEDAYHTVWPGRQLNHPPGDFCLLRNRVQLPGTGGDHRDLASLKQLFRDPSVVIGLGCRRRDMILIDQINQKLHCLLSGRLVEQEVLTKLLIQELAAVHSDEIPEALLGIVLRYKPVLFDVTGIEAGVD